MAIFFGIGLFEMLLIAAILLFLAAPLVVGGVIIWILLARGSGDKDKRD